MPDNVGLSQGLAVINPVGDRINDIRVHDQRLMQDKALAEAKAQLFADSVDYKNAANVFDNKKIRERNKVTILEIGKYHRENPDWRTNSDKRIIVNEMTKSLMDNEDSLRGFASDSAFKALDADLQEVAKNPNMHNKTAYNNLLMQKQNYLQYGNQNGFEAATKEGYKPFIYTKPADFKDLTKEGEGLGNNFKALRPVTLKNGRSGAWITEVDEKALDRDAQGFYLQNKEQFDQQHGSNALAASKEFIRSGIKTEWNYGDNHYGEQLALMKAKHKMDLDELIAKAKAKGGAPAMDYYAETILKPKRTADTPERLDAAFGSKIKHTITSDDGMVSFDNTGDVFNYNGDIQDQNYRQDGKYTPNGIKTVSGYVYKPLNWAIEKGIVNDPWGPNMGRDPKVDGNWKQKAELIDYVDPKDPTKSTEKMVKINVKADINATSPAYQGKYNSLVATAEQRNNMENPVDAVVKTININGIPVAVGARIKSNGKTFVVTENGPVEE